MQRELSPAWLAEGVSFLLRSNITTLALSICKVNVSGLLLSDIHRSKDLILDELRPVSDLLLSDIHGTFGSFYITTFICF